MGYEFDWSVLWTYRELLIDGFIMTLKLSIIGIFFAFLFGSIIGLARVSNNFFVSLFATYYVELFRNIPLVVQMFFIYYAFIITDAFPILKDVGNYLNVENDTAFFSALFALITYTSTYIAEAIRGGIQSLPKGQEEAAKTLGMNYLQIMYLIVYPQAIKLAWGPITSQFINLIKNSSLAMTITVAELTFSTQEIDSITFKGFEAATAVTLLYLFLTLTTSYIMTLIDKYTLAVTSSTGNNNIRSSLKSYYEISKIPFKYLIDLIGIFFQFIGRILFYFKSKISISGNFFTHFVNNASLMTINYFKKYKWMSHILNIVFIVFLLKLIHIYAFPDVNYGFTREYYDGFEGTFTLNRLEYMFFGEKGELGGLALTFVIAIIAIIFSFIFGSLLGIARYSNIKIIKIPATLYIELFRALPLIMVIFWIYFAIPIVGGAIFDVNMSVDALTSAIISFTLFESAYIAEIIRAGLKSIPKGQFEAAKTLGMNPWQTFTFIILPQAYRRMIPAIVSQFVSLFKDTSLVYVIGVTEFFRAATIINNRIYMDFEILSFVAFIYFICAFTLSKIAGKLEKKVEKQLHA